MARYKSRIFFHAVSPLAIDAIGGNTLGLPARPATEPTWLGVLFGVACTALLAGTAVPILGRIFRPDVDE